MILQVRSYISALYMLLLDLVFSGFLSDCCGFLNNSAGKIVLDCSLVDLNIKYCKWAFYEI